MKFMMMMNTPYGKGGDYAINEWTPETFKAHIAFMKSFNAHLREAGEFVGAEGLTPPGQARVVRAGKGGAPEVTDGPFAETREVLGGYYLILADDQQAALEIAAEHSGVHVGAVEVREVFDVSGSIPS